MEKAYKNAGYFMLLLVLLTVIGFYKTYFSQFPDFIESFTAITRGSITIFHHLHAALSSLWILFLIVQPLLIRSGKFKIHRAIGKISYVIFPLLVLSFVPLISSILESDHPGRAYGTISNSILLVLFYSLAVYNRKRTPNHMRYMIGTAFAFLGPTLGRIGILIVGLHPKTTDNSVYIIVYLILIGLILLDRKNGKNFKPYIVILVAWVIRQIVVNILL